MFKRQKAQTISEYVILATIVVTALTAMFPLVKRGAQSLIKVAADQIGDQKTSDQTFNDETGYMTGMNTDMRAFINDEVRAGYLARNTVEYLTDQRSETFTNTSSGLGFTKEE